MAKTQKQINDKALARINKRRENNGLSTVTITQYAAERKATEIRDEYKAALIDDAIAQAEKDLGEME